VYVVREDGSGLARDDGCGEIAAALTEVTPEDFEFSADGRSLKPSGRSLLIAEVDGSGVREVSSASRRQRGDGTQIAFRPPDGSVPFVGMTASTRTEGLVSLRSTPTGRSRTS
jgi:hypothetical protein